MVGLTSQYTDQNINKKDDYTGSFSNSSRYVIATADHCLYSEHLINLSNGWSILYSSFRPFILQSVINNFTEANDPYDEHDFGSFDYNGEMIYFKIDYYDKNYQYLSEDPANPNLTNRVMTIMLAEEY